MRTPLATIIFFVQFILKALNSERFSQSDLTQSIKYSRIVLSQAEFLKAFVGDLLDLRQLRLGCIELQKAPFSLVALLQNIFEIFAP